ncbi:MAG: phosphotransferase family protein [Acidimicrobiales bacterium]
MIDGPALARRLGVPAVEVTGAPSGGGWSNETVFVVAGGRELVVRLAPRGRSMFPVYDLSHQVRMLRLAADNGLPVPAVVADEPDPGVLGRPFFVMERVPGRVPPDDDPPFTRAGFLFEAPPADQRRFHDAAVDAIARVHQVGAPDFPVDGPQPGDHLAACARLAQWCGPVPAVVADALDELAGTAPEADAARCGLVWGDARPANMVVDDNLAVVALLDWELAGAGPGELDVAWLCEMNRMRSVGPAGLVPLPGFPPDETTWARWEAAVGRRADAMEWYQRFSAVRVAVLLQLYLAAMVHRGALPAGHRALSENSGTRRLRELFG